MSSQARSKKKRKSQNVAPTAPQAVTAVAPVAAGAAALLKLPPSFAGMTVLFGRTDPQVLPDDATCSTASDAVKQALTGTTSKLKVTGDRRLYLAYPFKDPGTMSVESLDEPVLLLYQHPKQPEDKATRAGGKRVPENISILSLLTDALKASVSATASPATGAENGGAGDGLHFHMEQSFHNFASIIQNQGYVATDATKANQALTAMTSFVHALATGVQVQDAFSALPVDLLRSLQSWQGGRESDLAARIRRLEGKFQPDHIRKDPTYWRTLEFVVNAEAEEGWSSFSLESTLAVMENGLSIENVRSLISALPDEEMIYIGGYSKADWLEIFNDGSPPHLIPILAAALHLRLA
jgi:hypothetical protein